MAPFGCDWIFHQDRGEDVEATCTQSQFEFPFGEMESKYPRGVSESPSLIQRGELTDCDRRVYRALPQGASSSRTRQRDHRATVSTFNRRRRKGWVSKTTWRIAEILCSKRAKICLILSWFTFGTQRVNPHKFKWHVNDSSSERQPLSWEQQQFSFWEKVSTLNGGSTRIKAKICSGDCWI